MRDTEKHGGIHDIKAGQKLPPPFGEGFVDLGHIGSQQGNDGQSRRADGKALGHGLDGISRAVQLVRDADGLFAQISHLRKASGVVHDGAVGVVTDDHAHDGEHAHSRHGDPEEGVAFSQRIAEHVGRKSGNGDAHHGGQGGNKA